MNKQVFKICRSIGCSDEKEVAQGHESGGRKYPGRCFSHPHDQQGQEHDAGKDISNPFNLAVDRVSSISESYPIPNCANLRLQDKADADKDDAESE